MWMLQVVWAALSQRQVGKTVTVKLQQWAGAGPLSPQRRIAMGSDLVRLAFRKPVSDSVAGGAKEGEAKPRELGGGHSSDPDDVTGPN